MLFERCKLFWYITFLGRVSAVGAFSVAVVVVAVEYGLESCFYLLYYFLILSLFL